MTDEKNIVEPSDKTEVEQQGFKIHINFEELRKKRLFITTPMYGKSASF